MKVKMIIGPYGDSIKVTKMTREEYLEFRKKMTAQRITADCTEKIIIPKRKPMLYHTLCPKQTYIIHR